MKKFSIIGKYPLMAILVISTTVFLLGPIILSLAMALLIVMPIYLAVQIFGNTD